jgi:L-threonylcarbamoyladenylate synthase
VNDRPPPPVHPADDPAALEAAVAALRAGGVVGVPTETVYGLASLPTVAGLTALIEAKGRSAEKGFALLIDDRAQVDELCLLPPAAARIADRFWPGSVTLVLPLRPGVTVPELLTGGRPTLAFRLPDHPAPRALARSVGPLALTSANRSGEPDATEADAVVAAVGRSIALVLDDGPVRGGTPSTVVAIDPEDAWTVLRAGAVPTGALAAAVAGRVWPERASTLDHARDDAEETP